MRQLLALVLLGVLALTLQGFLAALLPPAVVPDATLLVAVTAAVVLPPVPGLLLAVGIGYGADLLSGSLLGQHALLRVVAFAATLVISSQFQLRRGFPLFVFVLALALADAFLIDAAGRTFADARSAGLSAVGVAVWRALATAILAPLALGWMGDLGEWLQEGDGPRREVRLETRRPVL